MFDILAVTAQYSNAVMIAILPQVSDFATKLHLPIPLPITVNAVQHFGCMPFDNNPGGCFLLTNGYSFCYNEGHVDCFASPNSYSSLQNFDDFPKFYGKLEMSEDEAVALARHALTDLGYNLKKVFADQPPQVTPPPSRDGHLITVYTIEWHSPLELFPSETGIKVEVNGQRKSIEGMWLESHCFYAVPPPIGVPGPPAYSPRLMATTESNAFVKVILPKLSAFIEATRLPIPTPVSADDIASVDRHIMLKNGFRFWWLGVEISGFAAPDSVFAMNHQTPELPIDSYLGEWKLGVPECAQLVRNALKRLGFRVIAFEAKGDPSGGTPTKVGNYTVPRYELSWETVDKKSGNVLWEVHAEIDAGNGMLKSLDLPIEWRQ